MLGGCTLPWALRIAEVDLQTCIDLQARVLCHLGTLVPSQRSSQLLGQGGDGARNCVAYSFGSMAGERRTILHAGFLTVTCHSRQVQPPAGAPPSPGQVVRLRSGQDPARERLPNSP